MKRFFIMLFVLPVSLLAETVYKTVDEQGNTLFSDQPSANSEKLQIRKAPAVNFRKIEIPDRTRQQKSEKQDLYQALAIQQPANEATIRDNQGNVTVAVRVMPELRSGHVIELEMDGKGLGITDDATFMLQKVERGAHQLLARILDQEGNVLMSSEPVTFYLHKTSKLTGPLSKKSEGVTPLNPPTVSPEGVTPTRPPVPGSSPAKPAPAPRL